jgi:hypothetical protein
MTEVLAPLLFEQFWNATGTAPLVGGKLFSYVAGTSTKQVTYTDSTGGVMNANPVILDSAGTANVWLDPSLVYKFVLAPANDTDPPGSPIRTVDNVYPSLNTSSLTQAFIGEILYPQTPAELAASVVPVNLAYPSHLAIGIFIVDRYGTNTTPGTTDMTAAINNAIAVAVKNGGGTVQLMAVAYKTTSMITVPNGVTLRGMGRGNGLGSGVSTTGGTRLVPVGTFNAVSVRGANYLGGQYATAVSVQSLEIDGSGGCVGNGLDIYAAGLRCYFADLYIHNMTGMGMRIMSSFDHVYERIECRGNSSFGIQTYEKQNFVDGGSGVYEEQSFLRFIDVTAPSNNVGVQLTNGSGVTGTYQIAETVNQATSGASATVSYYDIGSGNLYLRSVTGTFDTSHVVTGATSGASATPTATSGATIATTQWDCAGGDNFYFISVKPTEGLVGLDFSRASANHFIAQMYFDAPSAGVGAAIRILAPGIGFTQTLRVERLQTFAAAVGVDIYGGQSLYIGDAPSGVNVRAGVTGPVFLTAPRTAFTDANTLQRVYPTENIATYVPVLGGNGSPAIGNGTLTGETYQHGNKVSLRIAFTVGSTTVMPTSGMSMTLPTNLAVKGSETQLANVMATHSGSNYSLIATMNILTIGFPISGTNGFWSASGPFAWAAGDTMVLTAEYEVN